MKEIVIKIDDKKLTYAREHNFLDMGSNELANAIINGTELPKGHGRISDMDEAIKCIEECKGEDAVYAIALIEWACGKRTLIEADKESGNERNCN